MPKKFWIISTVFLLLVAVLLLVGSCSKVQIERVKSDSDYKEGVRFYRPHPYLMVTQKVDEKGNKTLEGNIIYLPQMKEEYVAKVNSGIGSISATLKLEHGWRLTDFGEVRDSKVPETVKAFTEPISGIMGVLVKPVPPPTGEEKEEAMLSPGLWRFIFDDQGYVEKLIPIVKFEAVKAEVPQ